MVINTALAVAAFAANTVLVHNTKKDTLYSNHYSMFWETEINFGCEGGLYAELVWNRDFEALGRGTMMTDKPSWNTRQSRRDFLATPDPEAVKLGLDPNEPAPNYASIAPWTVVGGATVENQNATAPFSKNPFAVKVTTTAGGAGLQNPGYWGMNFRAGVAYNLTFYAMSVNVTSVTAYLTCGAGSLASSGSISITGSWSMYQVTLTPSSACFDGMLTVVANAAGVTYFDHISLFPGDAVLGLFRPDLMTYLENFAPPMIRLPGGNYLEGTGPRTRWAWKNTVGPRQQRSGHYNSAWGYWVTDGVGLLELLLLCEYLGADPLMSIYTGYSLGQQYIPLNQSQPFVEDCLDLMQYSKGNTSTLWGAQRAADGHAAPFNLRKLEIGNEETQQGLEGYAGHYQLITTPLRQEYPDVYVVASGLMVATSGGRSTSCLPCVGGCGMQPQQCEAWDEHTYDTPDNMANLLDLYDSYESASFCQTTTGGACPPVYVLEYGCHYAPSPDLQAGVSEGVFLLGTERNADAVQATAFAPLFVNVKGQQWGYNLINFNASHVFALPSYYVQVMLRKTTGDFTLQTDLSTQAAGSARWTAIASVKGSNTMYVKVANYGTANFTVALSFNGFPNLQLPTTAQYVGGSDPSLQNTLDAPFTVGSTTWSLSPQGQSLTITGMDTYSVLVFEATF